MKSIRHCRRFFSSQDSKLPHIGVKQCVQNLNVLIVDPTKASSNEILHLLTAAHEHSFVIPLIFYFCAIDMFSLRRDVDSAKVLLQLASENLIDQDQPQEILFGMTVAKFAKHGFGEEAFSLWKQCFKSNFSVDCKKNTFFGIVKRAFSKNTESITLDIVENYHKVVLKQRWNQSPQYANYVLGSILSYLKHLDKQRHNEISPEFVSDIKSRIEVLYQNLISNVPQDSKHVIYSAYTSCQLYLLHLQKLAMRRSGSDKGELEGHTSDTSQADILAITNSLNSIYTNNYSKQSHLHIALAARGGREMWSSGVEVIRGLNEMVKARQMQNQMQASAEQIAADKRNLTSLDNSTWQKSWSSEDMRNNRLKLLGNVLVGSNYRLNWDVETSRESCLVAMKKLLQSSQVSNNAPYELLESYFHYVRRQYQYQGEYDSHHTNTNTNIEESGRDSVLIPYARTDLAAFPLLRDRVFLYFVRRGTHFSMGGLGLTGPSDASPSSHLPASPSGRGSPQLMLLADQNYLQQISLNSSGKEVTGVQVRTLSVERMSHSEWAQLLVLHMISEYAPVNLLVTSSDPTQIRDSIKEHIRKLQNICCNFDIAMGEHFYAMWVASLPAVTKGYRDTTAPSTSKYKTPKQALEESLKYIYSTILSEYINTTNDTIPLKSLHNKSLHNISETVLTVLARLSTHSNMLKSVIAHICSFEDLEAVSIVVEVHRERIAKSGTGILGAAEMNILLTTLHSNYFKTLKRIKEGRELIKRNSWRRNYSDMDDLKVENEKTQVHLNRCQALMKDVLTLVPLHITSDSTVPLLAGKDFDTIAEEGDGELEEQEADDDDDMSFAIKTRLFLENRTFTTLSDKTEVDLLYAVFRTHAVLKNGMETILAMKHLHKNNVVFSSFDYSKTVAAVVRNSQISNGRPCMQRHITMHGCTSYPVIYNAMLKDSMETKDYLKMCTFLMKLFEPALSEVEDVHNTNRKQSLKDMKQMVLHMMRSHGQKYSAENRKIVVEYLLLILKHAPLADFAKNVNFMEAEFGIAYSPSIFGEIAQQWNFILSLQARGNFTTKLYHRSYDAVFLELLQHNLTQMYAAKDRSKSERVLTPFSALIDSYVTHHSKIGSSSLTSKIVDLVATEYGILEQYCLNEDRIHGSNTWVKLQYSLSQLNELKAEKIKKSNAASAATNIPPTTNSSPVKNVLQSQSEAETWNSWQLLCNFFASGSAFDDVKSFQQDDNESLPSQRYGYINDHL